MEFFEYIANNWESLLGVTTAILTAIIAVCMLIPGPQPEQALKSIVEFLEKFSKK